MSASGDAAADAARVIAGRTGVASHEVALVLGSGWARGIESCGHQVASVPSSEIPGLARATVPGHDAQIRSFVTLADARLLVLGARHHFYERRDVEAVAFPIRVAAAAGCRILILTNASGSIRPKWRPGTPVVLSDHINLTSASPLVGPRFIDMTDAYSPRLRSLVRGVDPTIPEGVYAQFPGPQYETPAEVRAAAALGADLVGMSTALEAIAARSEGLEVLALSLVTNLAAGVASTPLSHEEVLAAGEAAAPRLSTLLADILALV